MQNNTKKILQELQDTEVGRVKDSNLSREMETAYLEYAMSVISSRALPDVRDGLKPVQRRILYVMNEEKLYPSNRFVKVNSVVGTVMGKYHPHGDSSIYEALVRLAQNWVMRHPLVWPQGNFGAIDGSSPAASRYIECKMMPITMEILSDIDKDTVEFSANYDGELKEPTVLPTSVPLLLLEGANGIAVGMTTNIPSHNLRELCDALILLLQHPNVSHSDILRIIKGPDFSTGGIIFAPNLTDIYNRGRGKITVRAKVTLEESAKGREQIVIHEIPYGTNTTNIISKIVEQATEGKIEGIVNVQDETDKDTDLRITVELKKGVDPAKIVNALYAHTGLESTFGINMVALVDGQPQTLSLKEMLQYFRDYRYP